MSGFRSRGKAWRFAAALVLAGVVPGSAAAQSSPLDDMPEREEDYGPRRTFPEGINGVVRPGGQDGVERIDTLRDIFRVLSACWKPPSGSGFTGQEITLRIAFKRNGEVLGQPKITFYRPGTGHDDQREAFTRSVQETFTRCTPLPFTEKLGAAVAGRLFNFRFSDTRPM